MADYFNNFPITYYSLGENKASSLDTVTNIISRFGFESSLKENSSAFYPYTIKDTDTPEIIASKFYNNPERHWIVLAFNDIVDPQFDWPLPYSAFNQYVDEKYSGTAYANNSTSGAGLSWAKNALNIHSYYKIVVRKAVLNNVENKTITEKLQIDANTYANVASSTTNYTLADGTSIIETVSKESLTYYQFEENENNDKRKIRLLKPEFIPTVMKEFREIINPS